MADAPRGESEAGGGDTRYGRRVVARRQRAIFHLPRRGTGLFPEEKKNGLLNLIEKLNWSSETGGGAGVEVVNGPLPPDRIAGGTLKAGSASAALAEYFSTSLAGETASWRRDHYRR